MISEKDRLEAMLRDLARPVALPEMTKPQQDTTERRRLEVQAIEFALPEKRLTHELNGKYRHD